MEMELEKEITSQDRRMEDDDALSYFENVETEITSQDERLDLEGYRDARLYFERLVEEEEYLSDYREKPMVSTEKPSWDEMGVSPTKRAVLISIHKVVEVEGEDEQLIDTHLQDKYEDVAVCSLHYPLVLFETSNVSWEYLTEEEYEEYQKRKKPIEVDF